MEDKQRALVRAETDALVAYSPRLRASIAELLAIRLNPDEWVAIRCPVCLAKEEGAWRFDRPTNRHRLVCGCCGASMTLPTGLARASLALSPLVIELLRDPRLAAIQTDRLLGWAHAELMAGFYEIDRPRLGGLPDAVAVADCPPAEVAPEEQEADEADEAPAPLSDAGTGLDLPALRPTLLLAEAQEAARRAGCIIVRTPEYRREAERNRVPYMRVTIIMPDGSYTTAMAVHSADLPRTRPPAAKRQIERQAAKRAKQARTTAPQARP